MLCIRLHPPHARKLMSAADPSPFNWSNRLLGLMLFIPTASLLGVAAWVSPDAEGHGTHTQLGMAPCGFVERTGLPCATCGMTTSFAHAADGNLISSFITQPAGAVLAVTTAMVCLFSFYAMLMGVNLLPIFRITWKPKIIILFGVLVMGAWIYKIAVFQGIHT